MKTIDALVEALENYVNGCSMSVNAAEVARAALAQARAEQAEPVSYADCQQRIGPPITFFTSIAAQAYRAAATRDDVSHEDAMRHALNEVQRARYATAPTPPAATVTVLEPLIDGGRVMVDCVPPATSRDRWFFEQGRLAERDPRTHAVEAAKLAPLTEEQDRALCEAYCNTASDEFFKARPSLDTPENRRIFYAGHRKAWIERDAAVEAAHAAKLAKRGGV